MPLHVPNRGASIKDIIESFGVYPTPKWDRFGSAMGKTPRTISALNLYPNGTGLSKVLKCGR